MISEIKLMPKVMLHIHLDGSVRPSTISSITGNDIEYIKNKVVADINCNDLNDYISKFSIPVSIMQTSENLERISYECVSDLKDDGVIYAEVRFAPLKHIEGGLSLDEVIESVLRGVNKVDDIDVNLILCMMRGDSFDNNMRVIDLACKYLNKGVCGIDLAGAEALYDTSCYEELFDIARDKGIPFTIHAGETMGPSSIRDAIRFGASRIGHGVKCLEDTEVVNLIKKKDILLEVCPTSNIQTNVFSGYEKFPGKILNDSGVKICLNTDNNTVSNVSLSEEYENMIKYNGFTISDIISCNKNAIRKSFASQVVKDKVLDKLIEYEKNI